MATPTLSDPQRETLVRCVHAAEADAWYRAEGHGERVTLASLYRHQLLERRVWRGEGTASPAHEYRAVKVVLDVVAEIREKRPVDAAPFTCNACRSHHESFFSVYQCADCSHDNLTDRPV